MATSATSYRAGYSPQPTLYLAFELGQNTWKLGFTIGVAQQPRERMIPSGDVDTLQQEITRAKQRFGLPEDARVVSLLRLAATALLAAATSSAWRPEPCHRFRQTGQSAPTPGEDRSARSSASS